MPSRACREFLLAKARSQAAGAAGNPAFKEDLRRLALTCGYPRARSRRSIPKARIEPARPNSDLVPLASRAIDSLRSLRLSARADWRHCIAKATLVGCAAG